jgi:carboxypeptidase Taq
MMPQTYKKLEDRFAQLTALKEIDNLLDWDRSVLMPEEGVDQRARQVAALNVKMHEMLADPAVGEWIAKTDRKSLNEWQKANLAVMERQYRDATAVSASLIERKMLQETKTEVIWRRARAESDFKQVSGELEKLLEIVREYGAAKGAKMGVSPYDALMDGYAPYMTSAEVDVIFDDLAKFLPGFIGEVIGSQKQPLKIKAPVPVDKQEKFGRQLAGLLGFNFKWGRLDISAHPFSMGIGGDVRITTRYSEDDFMNSIQGVTHEAGHGFYDRHTPAEWRHQPVGISGNMGMAIHESQSLSLDMQLGRSSEYWGFLSPHLQKAFGVSGPEWGGENLACLATYVERGFIRVDADEVTYPAHVILRYRLEKQMVDGKLKVKDLPEAWNAGMKELIGAVPPNDRLGCLQDIHWYGGSFGYFPAYALGAMIAAQFVDKMKRDIPDLSAHLRKGNFGVFTGWLKDNVQSKGCLYKPQELIEKVTGQPMSASFFKKHLTDRYLGKTSCSTTSAQGARRRA